MPGWEINPLYRLSLGSHIMSFCPVYPQNWENNMLLNYAYPYQPCALHVKHGYTFHEQVHRTSSKDYHNPK
jgi:hypothetical protein